MRYDIEAWGILIFLECGPGVCLVMCTRLGIEDVQGCARMYPRDVSHSGEVRLPRSVLISRERVTFSLPRFTPQGHRSQHSLKSELVGRSRLASSPFFSLFRFLFISLGCYLIFLLVSNAPTCPPPSCESIPWI